MIKVILSLIYILSSLISYSQDKVEASLILLINDQLVVGSLANLRIINSQGYETEALYLPGKLIFERKEFDENVSHADSLVLAFDYLDTIDNKQHIANYRLPFDKHWLHQDFLIMKVYNLEVRKYKRRFDPLDSKRNYTFELLHSEGQMVRVKRVKKKS